jgi:hypothetical protein
MRRQLHSFQQTFSQSFNLRLAKISVGAKGFRCLTDQQPALASASHQDPFVTPQGRTFGDRLCELTPKPLCHSIPAEIRQNSPDRPEDV